MEQLFATLAALITLKIKDAVSDDLNLRWLLLDFGPGVTLGTQHCAFLNIMIEADSDHGSSRWLQTLSSERRSKLTL